MLILTLKVGQKVCIGDDVTVEVREVNRGKVRLAVQAPIHIPVDREEVRLRKQARGAEHAQD